MPSLPMGRLSQAQKKIPALAAFEIPAFRRIFTLPIFGTFAQGTIFTTLGWVIADETGSEILVALIAVSFLAPQLFAGPFGGLVADRWGRARLLRFGMAIRVATSLAMAASIAWPLLIINVIGATISGAIIPARRALNVDVVPKNRLTNAVAMEEFAVSGGFLLSLLAAGALLLFVAPQWLLAGTAVMYVMTMALVPNTPKRPNHPVKTDDSENPATGAVQSGEAAFAGTLRMFLDGLSLAWSIPAVRAALAISFLAEILTFNDFSLLPIYATEVYGGGPATLGSLESTVSLGEVLGVFVIAWIGIRVIRPGRWFIIGTIAANAVAIPLAITTSASSAYVLVLGLGIAAALYSVLSSRVMIQAVPESARAKLLGVQQMTWGGGAIGGLMTGGLATAYSPAAAVGSLAIIGLVVITAIAIMSSSLRGVTTVSEQDDDSDSD